MTFTQYDFSQLQWLKKTFVSSMISVVHCLSGQESPRKKRWITYLQNEIGNKITYEEHDINLQQFVSPFEKSDDRSKILCMTTRTRNFWSRLINPSTTIELLTETEVEVLIFKYIENEYD